MIKLLSSLPQFTDFRKLLDSYYLWFDKKRYDYNIEAQRFVQLSMYSLRASSTVNLIIRKLGVSVDAREGLKEVLIGIGLS